MAKIVNLYFKFILMLFSQFLLAPFKQILLLTDDFSLTIITFNRSDVGRRPCRLDGVVLFYTQCKNSIQRMLSKITIPGPSRPWVMYFQKRIRSSHTPTNMSIVIINRKLMVKYFKYIFYFKLEVSETVYDMINISITCFKAFYVK